MYWAAGQKHAILYPGMLSKVFGLDIAHLALWQLYVNIKVKVRSGYVSDRIVL